MALVSTMDTTPNVSVWDPVLGTRRIPEPGELIKGYRRYGSDSFQVYEVKASFPLTSGGIVTGWEREIHRTSLKPSPGCTWHDELESTYSIGARVPHRKTGKVRAAPLRFGYYTLVNEDEQIVEHTLVR